MTDSLRLFQTEEEYNAVRDSLEYPTVSYVEGGRIHYTLQPLATPLYIEALVDGMTVALNSNNLEYSTDLRTWSVLPMNTASPIINTGERIYLRGNATVGETGIGQFTISQQCNLGGNIMSLLFNDDFEDKTDLRDYDGIFMELFAEQPIVDASKLLLPATTLSMDCCMAMFYGCTSLVTAPELPAAPSLPGQCYQAMFSGCTSLTTPPELPATSLAGNCYWNMFSGCTSLTTAPELPSPNGAHDRNYMGMFSGCSNLNYIKMLSTTIGDGLIGWVNGVSATGTFVKDASLSEETIGRGVNGIPEGWTVVNAE